MPTQNSDVVVVGAGIAGLAHALAASKAGHSVTVVERDQRAVGASVRNFGLVWPIGQFVDGNAEDYDRGCRSKQVWTQVAADTGMWFSDHGALHLAYAPDELAVLDEFVASTPEAAADGARMLTPAEIEQLSPWVKTAGLLGGMHSSTEVNVDPRVAIPTVARWLEQKHGVSFLWGTAVLGIELPRIQTSRGVINAERVIICSGNEFQQLYPEAFEATAIRRCKLQMMRTQAQPEGWNLGPALCAGLTLLHYDSFKALSSLPALRERLDAELPFHRANGIHVLVSQTAGGQITIGDSHHYDLTQDPFETQDVFDAILDYFDTFVSVPRREIAETWHGIYPSLPDGKRYLLSEPEPGVSIVNGLGGAGMTMSFGLAQDHLAGNLAVTTPHGELAAAPSH
ncbi:TIGR03364 family FAD-dependent oxidoreductase [Saxibacter everestensis]|uniref:TIGR03364 family FAD-dependent oxidoreductase n=1 Tax=Saxibacter everestensis TaxID=2909229 RepID=A0ABY8QRR8_9MICO|nr:TIGR03364 family FAD-dependent oxidoreductase [Brevibacteriaceae bacterium ZFBP1038]